MLRWQLLIIEALGSCLDKNLATDTIRTTKIDTPSEPGDVPGWASIILMTSGLVVVIWSDAGPRYPGFLNTRLPVS